MPEIHSSVPRVADPLSAPLPPSPGTPVSKTKVPALNTSQRMLEQVKSSTDQTHRLKELTGSEAVGKLEHDLQGQNASVLQSRSGHLASGLAGSSLEKDLQRAETEMGHLKSGYKQGMQVVSDLEGTARLMKGEVTADTLKSGTQTLSRLEQAIGSRSGMSKTLKDVDTVLSSKKDVDQSLALMDGKISAENLRSATRVTQTAAQLSGHSAIAKGTGKVLAPLNAVCSGKASLKACEKLWDEPNLENLHEAGSQVTQFLKDLKASIELVPGGHLLTRAIDKLLKSVVPGANLIALGDQFLKMVGQVKLAIDKPTALNISNAVLEVVKTTASAGQLAGGVVGYASAAVYTGAEFVQTLVNTDWNTIGTKVSDSVSSMVSSASSYLGSATRWLGFA
ncbi:hypothetical protein COW36_24645 [bacterium (Candidatus Blackallbacteria) CG17_big_fil_post_rev_8_21_14_2_50_48_46]|uniref:Uncharacterized protein n=1 Tax=bacterium (Candidatus Blackallbacteria) CG17_big_fil_post_rev_8_21_14_2_50_48_46 TaxID=2014261 RepID=A0A2M7FX70_9BACT|nr:MAG: hypothetical protein COW64_19585 [bacterium (Candidatus Blackallbacteria) CG18_big_fil_WC_8_21_14_2_50_49_26]PIW13858.1 MAG: hypothetical protein COW36_24645 [bacterium (Candidatus Blackallbacteria) CG17_big_fil_post_rev_8_21_14_2_50_48_46]PIW45084.1 MAG: hypothetical protein COW20_22275 [bacterium (Candidatus Blackallbacteria) CG13_big_fil_rev_8_21_14_2_50_49_14]